MKALLALVLISGSVLASPVEDMINKNTQDTFKQIEALRNPKANYPTFECSMTITEEQTGKKFSKVIHFSGEGLQFKDSQSEYQYYEGDDSGSSSGGVDKKTLRGYYSSQTAEGQVDYTGNGQCKRTN